MFFLGFKGGLKDVQRVGSKGGFEGWARKVDFKCAWGKNVSVNAVTEWFGKVGGFKGESAVFRGLKGDLKG